MSGSSSFFPNAFTQTGPDSFVYHNPRPGDTFDYLGLSKLLRRMSTTADDIARLLVSDDDSSSVSSLSNASSITSENSLAVFSILSEQELKVMAEKGRELFVRAMS